MPQRPLALVGLADLRHGERRHGARAHPRALDGRLEDQRIHHRRQHSHCVGGRPRQAVFGYLRSAQNVAAADDDAEPDAERVRGDKVGGEAVDGRLIDAELFRTAQASPESLTITRRYFGVAIDVASVLPPPAVTGGAI